MTTKTITITLLMIIAVLSAGCGTAVGIFNRHAGTNDAQTEAIAAEIAGFDLPRGYTPSYALTWQGYSIATFGPGDNHSHLTLIQAPADADLSSFDPSQVLSDRGATGVRIPVKVVETREAVIRGETVTLTVSEGTSGSDGTAYREVSAAFTGKLGPAFLVWNEPVDGWDWGKVDAFLASIR